MPSEAMGSGGGDKTGKALPALRRTREPMPFLDLGDFEPNPEKPEPPAPPAGEPFAYFRWNGAWGMWEQIVDEAKGEPGVIAAYREPKHG